MLFNSDDELTISEFFDPDSISVSTRPMTVQQLLTRLENNQLNLAPEFQRNQGIWTQVAKSRLIESVLIRFPIPAFYIDATNEEEWFVIDGIQRLTTFKEFLIEETLELKNLEFLDQLNGGKSSDIPNYLRRRIRETELTIFLILRGTSKDVIFSLYKRINRGGSPLSSQEMRYAKSKDKARDLLTDLAKSQSFKNATDKGLKDRRMLAQECILRFLALTDNHAFEYNFKDYDVFLNDKMAQINQMSEQEIELLRQRFERAMDAAFQIFGKDAFRKPKSPERKRRYPINKALFEAWSVNLDRLDDHAIQILAHCKNNLYHNLLNRKQNGEFDAIIYRSTGNKESVKKRLAHIETIIKEVLK
ncbi:DUF262 domain-containing protein [Planktothrix agardhii]|jgi:hypothetical protein|uniref:DUF262 domain-containing protein n=1 Tax=Planktothrix agardhii TaxID=1160 RepID=UPI00041963CF|nr:DUF262 domain-containing protein [Planktothrix agardhii]CAD5979740.1 hypothetical protein NO758_04483 [Planktothrix agardhii]